MKPNRNYNIAIAVLVIICLTAPISGAADLSGGNCCCGCAVAAKAQPKVAADFAMADGDCGRIGFACRCRFQNETEKHPNVFSISYVRTPFESSSMELTADAAAFDTYAERHSAAFHPESTASQATTALTYLSKQSFLC